MALHPQDFCKDWVGDDALCGTAVPANVELVVLACPTIFAAITIISTLYLTERAGGSATRKSLLGIAVACIYPYGHYPFSNYPFSVFQSDSD